MLQFAFEIKPEPKLRARMGKFGAYTPEKTKNAEELIKFYASRQLPPKFELLDTALEVHMIFQLERPKSVPKSKNVPTTRPDLDNYVKLVCDAFNGVVWKDDGLIWCIKASKVYGDKPNILVGVFPKKSATYKNNL